MSFRVGDRVRFKRVFRWCELQRFDRTITGTPRTGMTDERIDVPFGDADMQQTVLQVCAIDHDVVGEHEPALERTAGDAAIQHLTLLAVVGHLAGNDQRVVLDDHVQFIRAEPATAMVRW
jgi:hypothetical protein